MIAVVILRRHRSDMLPNQPQLDLAAIRRLGLGICLYLSRSIVHLHRGTIEARSEGPGRGREVRISLPAHLCLPTAGAEVSEPAPSSHISSNGPKRRSILIVDDNVDAADSLATLLVASGHEVATAYDGPAALSAAIAAPPEFILLDIGMPGMDGYKVAQQLRANQRLEGMRMIAITGYGEDAARERSRQAGFDLHLTKPIDPDHLLALIEQGCR
jgi:CheY-like chemotaxis protein